MRLIGTYAKINKLWGVLLPAAAVTALVFAFVLWSSATSAGLASAVTRLCHGIFSQCLGYVGFAHMTLLWAGGLTLLSGIIFAACRCIATLIRSKGALKKLPLKNKGGELVLINDSSMATAFTHGILHPRIYISKGLMNGLDGPELRAVFLHELCHKKNRDPLRFFLLSILRDIFFFIPLAAYALRLLKDRQEKHADDMAASYMREPFSIAGALVKLLGAGAARPAETASILGRKGFIEERIGRLLGEEVKANTKKGPSPKIILISLILPVIMLISLAMPLKEGMPSKMSTCATSHCADAKEKPDRNCRIHCDKTRPIHRPTPLKTLP